MSRLCLTVSSGRGPREVRQFVRALADHLSVLLAARHVRVLRRVVHGNDDLPDSIDLLIEGDRAACAGLVGTHALLMRSQQRGRRARKRWHVGVSCVELPSDGSSALCLEDVTIEACRARGPGGQHVNRTESAVRVVHRPTGISLRVESERSQHQNRALALERLKQALAQRARAEHSRVERARRGRSLQVERGRPVALWTLRAGVLARTEADHAQ